MASITELHFFKRQATGPKPERAKTLQDTADAQSAIAKLQSLRLQNDSFPADAVVITDTTFAVIHDPVSPPEVVETTDGTVVFVQSILDSRPRDAKLIDILSQLKHGVMSGELPKRILASVAVFDRTTIRNPLGARGGSLTVKNIDVDGVIIPTYILSRKDALDGTINWA